MQKLTVSPSPHIRSSATTSGIMTHVLISLLPAAVAAAIIFGGRAMILMGFCVAACILWEKLFCLVTKRKDPTEDLSAAVTGLLLAFNLPPTLPLWMALIGCFVAIVITKQLFGGIGQNFANPAIVGRIVLMLSFPTAMTTWVAPFYYREERLVTSATPLVTGKDSYKDLFLGLTGGCLGEVCAAALLLGGIYLIAVRVITPQAPIAFIGTVALFSFLVGEDPLYQILAGGVMLGAFFMATDYVTTPITGKGKFIFGVGCGLITCLIRFYASKPEGVSFAILLMNILVPYIDMATGSKPLGAKKPEKKKEGAKQ